MLIRKDSTINEIVHCYPESVKFFSDLNMSCSSCFSVNFDILENVALMHGMDFNVLIQKLRRYVKNQLAPIALP